MPPCHTTPIFNIDSPDFSITLFHPTARHPHPSQPQQTALTAKYFKTPTQTILNITIHQQITINEGKIISGYALASLINERRMTLANPFGAE
eukprot:12401744-Karenia_brevis.AAC.1